MLISSKIVNGLQGCVKIPGDKSISHRSIIIPSISKGISEISNLLMSDDVLHTINAMKAMGVKINQRVPLSSNTNKYNEKYISTKIKKLGHLI